MKLPSYQMLPKLTSAQYEALKNDIAARGILVPIEVDEQGNVLDGHHRLRAATELGLPEDKIPKITRPGLSEDEKVEHVLRLNLLRRQLSRVQRRKLAVELRLRRWTQERIAEVLGVHVPTISRWLRDVSQMQNVDAESGHPKLPDTILDRRGRRQPATKARRSGVRSEFQQTRPQAENATTDGSVAQPAPGSQAPADLALVSQPVPDNSRVPAPSSADSTEPQSKSLSGRFVEGPSLDYLRASQPEQFPEPGPLTPGEYDRALSFEAVLCLLRRLRSGETAQVLDPWRRWHEHHGNPRASEEAADLLVGLARVLRPRRPAQKAERW